MLKHLKENTVRKYNVFSEEPLLQKYRKDLVSEKKKCRSEEGKLDLNQQKALQRKEVAVEKLLKILQ